MRGTYTLGGAALTLANQAVTLAFLNPGSGAGFTGIAIRRLWASQNGVTTGAQQRVQYNTQVTAFPTLVSATPSLTSGIDQASKLVGGTAGAAGTCGVNASNEGGGAKSNIVPDTFNILSGYLLLFTPEELVTLPAGSASGFGFHFPAAAGTLAGWSFGVTFSELG